MTNFKMKSLQNIISQRRSVRKYANQSIDKQTIIEIIESARLAPSAVNFQPWKFYVCQSEEAKQIVRESYPREWFNAAPLYILACGDREQSWKRPCDGKDHVDIDIAIAVEHMVLVNRGYCRDVAVDTGADDGHGDGKWI